MKTIKKNTHEIFSEENGFLINGNYTEWMNKYCGKEKWDEGGLFKFLLGDKTIYLYDNTDCIINEDLHDLALTKQLGTQIITISLTEPQPCLVEKYVGEDELHALAFIRDILLIPAKREETAITIYAKVYSGQEILMIEKKGEYYFDRLQSLLQRRIVWRKVKSLQCPKN